MCGDILRDNPSRRTPSMPVNKFVPALALCLLLGTAAAHANIVKLEITRVEPAGPTHERISGKAYGELDPGRSEERGHHRHRPRAAKRSRQGRIRHHVHSRKADGDDEGQRRLLYTVVNRGGGNADAASGGSCHARQRLAGGRRPNLDQSHHSGTCCEESRRFEHYRTAAAAVHESDRTHDAAGHSARPAFAVSPVSLDTSKASLISATGEAATGEKKGAVKIASTDWAFADCSTTPFPGKPDPGSICVKNGFNPALLYELQYTVKDPLVLGIGLAATRDLGAFFRYETATPPGRRIRSRAASRTRFRKAARSRGRS